MSVRRKTGSKPLAFITSLMVLFALVVPFLGTALANHDRGQGIRRIDAGADDTAPANTCNSFTVTAFGANDVRAEYETLDIRAFQADGDVNRDIEIAFCDPDGNGQGSNLTGGDPGSTSGQQTGTGTANPGRDCDDDGNTAENQNADGTNQNACPTATTTGGEAPANIHDECITDANGNCTFGIISNSAGPMTVIVFNDNGENAQGVTGGVAGDDIRNGSERFDEVRKEWTAGAGTARNISCTPPSDFNPDGTRHEFQCTVTDANGAVIGGETVTFDVTAGPNSEEVGPTNCGGAQGAATSTSTSAPTSRTNNQGQTPTPAPEQNTGGQATTGTANRNTQACGYDDAGGAGNTNSLPGTDTIVAYVNLPQQPGGGVPTAGPDAGEPSVTITKTWVGPARTIDCEPETATNQVGTTHTITCTVRDRAQNPAQGVLVDITIRSGPGAFQAATTNCVTNEQGQCLATLETTTFSGTGTTVVRGEIDADTVNNPSNADDRAECARVAGDPAGAPAGACFDDVSKTWTRQGPAQCNDGVDNDGDGRIDFGQDPGCADINDNTESPDPGTTVDCNDGVDNDGDGLIDHPNDPGCVSATDTSEVDGGGNGEPARVATNLTIRYNRAANAFKGAVGSNRKPCQVGRTVILKKIVPGPNRTVGRDTSNRQGNWQINKRVRRGRFYAIALRQTETARNGQTLICLRDRSVTIKLRRR